MKITETVHLVASGATGFDLTHALDCNVFLFTDGHGHHVFDAGAGIDIDGMLEAIRFGGLDPAGLRTVFLTHGHADHSGGVAALKARFPKLCVVSGEKTAALLAHRDERLISLDQARGRFYPLDYVWDAAVVDRVMQPGETMEVGPFAVTLHETPGHSADHCCYTVSGGATVSLVAGDALFAGGKVVLQDIEDCSIAQSLKSIRTLSRLRFEQFLPGHGTFSLRDGERHVRAGMVHAEAGLPPPQL